MFFIIRKRIVLLLIISFLNYIGCYSYQAVTLEEFLSSFDKDISIKTKEQNSYLFDEGDYTIRNDTISGRGVLKGFKHGNEDWSIYEGEIAFTDIIEFKVQKFNALLTIISSVIFIGILVFALSLIDPFEGASFDLK